MSTYRVFPRLTRATPDDGCAIVNRGPYLYERPERVEISVAFTWDLPRAEQLAKLWSMVAPVEIGGPATGQRGEEFVPGRYLRDGYVITSRGCPNRCWFCQVWRRDGNVRELAIADGWNVLDDNLLACSEPHIRAVFAMLGRQCRRAVFSGGLEAARLQDWHVDLLTEIRPEQMFFAYDTPDDYEPLREAGRMLLQVFSQVSHALRCYVLIGYPGDTFDAAESRCRAAWEAGFFPMAMLYNAYERAVEWRRFQRTWANPRIVAQQLKEQG